MNTIAETLGHSEGTQVTEESHRAGRTARSFASLRMTVALILTVFSLIISAFPVHAEIKPSDYGVGLMAGSPSGATFKYWLTKASAVDAGMGIIGEQFALTSTYLWHDFSLIPKPASWDCDLPFYIGAGARLRFTSDPRFGARTIIGISYIPHSKPLEFFGELGPFFRFTPDVGLSLDGAVGFRYYFKAL